jgi:hypothetical protein
MAFDEVRKYLKTRPIVVFTADQDWAPEWACEIFVDQAKKNLLPFHIFRTNKSPTIDNAVADGILTHGWHPNFKTDSTHGNSISEVISTMQKIAPGSRTVRAHSYFESSETWDYLFKAGQTVESHGLTSLEENLLPLRMASKFIRIPVFFEDDVLLRDSPNHLDCELIKKRLETPGLKVLDFHPIHIGLNSKSLDDYEQFKKNSNSHNFYEQTTSHRGIRNVLQEISDFARVREIKILSFEHMIDELLSS